MYINNNRVGGKGRFTCVQIFHLIGYVVGTSIIVDMFTIFH